MSLFGSHCKECGEDTHWSSCKCYLVYKCVDCGKDRREEKAEHCLCHEFVLRCEEIKKQSEELKKQGHIWGIKLIS